MNITTLPDLPVQSREIAILVVGTKYGAVYELYAHTQLALKTTNLDSQMVEQIKQGIKPQDLSRTDSIAYDVASALVSETGPLKNELWQRSLEVLGRSGTTALIQFVGFYSWVCTVLNGFDVPAPEH